MDKNNVLDFVGREDISDALTALLKAGTQQLISQAVEAELQDLLAQHSEYRTSDDKMGGGAQRILAPV